MGNERELNMHTESGGTMRTIAIVVALMGVILFSKLYLAGPSATDGQQVVAKMIHDNSLGNMKLADFKATGGKEYILSGVRVYVMTFEGSVECTNSSSAGSTVQFAFDRREGADATPMHAGEHRQVKGAIQFEKTSYAWVGQPM
jgi:hypothetical protein